MLSQCALLLYEPRPPAPQSRPGPDRIPAALLEHIGPYSPYLDIARALESPRTRATHALCNSQHVEMEEVNRALLRTLAALPAPPCKRAVVLSGTVYPPL